MKTDANSIVEKKIKSNVEKLKVAISVILNLKTDFEDNGNLMSCYYSL